MKIDAFTVITAALFIGFALVMFVPLALYAIKRPRGDGNWPTVLPDAVVNELRVFNRDVT